MEKKVKFKIKAGDQVKVIAGDAKDATGKVTKIITEKNRVIIEGVNMVSKHTKPNAANPQGGIIKKEAAIHISNVALIDAKGDIVRVGRKKNDAGKLVRVSKKSGEEIK
ncbi:50S ribosomal protein L24 [Mucilaginibacter sp.]